MFFFKFLILGDVDIFSEIWILGKLQKAVNDIVNENTFCFVLVKLKTEVWM